MSEAQIQADLFHFLDSIAYQVPEARKVFHVPNGGLRSRVTAAKLVGQGVRRGVPDVLYLAPSADGRYYGLAIEMKYGKNRLTAEQNEWMAYLRGIGWHTAICYDWQIAARVILEYMGKDPNAYWKK